MSDFGFILDKSKVLGAEPLNGKLLFLLVLISEIFEASRFCSLISEHRDFAALFVFHVRRLNYRIMVIGLKNRYECRESSARDVRGFGFRTPTEYYEFQHLNS